MKITRRIQGLCEDINSLITAKVTDHLATVYMPRLAYKPTQTTFTLFPRILLQYTKKQDSKTNMAFRSSYPGLKGSFTVEDSPPLLVHGSVVPLLSSTLIFVESLSLSLSL
jgi:hypothetical protein